MSDNSNIIPGPVPSYLHRSHSVHPVIQYGRDQVRHLVTAAAGVGLLVLALLITAAVKL